MKLSARIQSVRLLTFIAIISLSAGVRNSIALENGVGRTPAMGFNPWNAFKSNYNLAILKEVMDSMVTNGMRDAGYIYMCTDGELGFNLQDFANYGHSKGFKMGFYAGNGDVGKEAANVAKWASMGMDYLKHDYYEVSWTDPSYTRMRAALKTCGRPVYLAIHPNDKLPKPVRPDTVCNAMRVANDISWTVNFIPWHPNRGEGVMGEVMNSRKYEHLAHPGYFNDMDMMGVGISNLTTVEAQTHFNFWCIMASLLIEGSDVRHLPKERLNILINREVIAVNQDSLGEQGKVVWYRYAGSDSTEVISKRMKDSSRAVMLFNRYGPTRSITVRLSDIGLNGPVHVRDLVGHVNLPDATDSVTVSGIVERGSAMLRISKSPISNIYHKAPAVASIKSSAAQAPTVRLFNTRSMSRVEFLPGHTGVEIYNLQGALLREAHRGGMKEGGGAGIPASIKNAGMVVVRFVK